MILNSSKEKKRKNKKQKKSGGRRNTTGGDAIPIGRMIQIMIEEIFDSL